MSRPCLLLLAACLGVSSAALADNPYLTNPLGLYYYSAGDDSGHAFENVEAYKKPTALLITGQCNRGDPNFAQARAAGAEVLAYFNTIERKDVNDPCPAYTDLYRLLDGSPVPLWGNDRVNFDGYHMVDIRVGSPWIDKVVSFVEGLMTSDTVDGVFLDVVASRLWGSLPNWNGSGSTWTQAERDAWTAGSVDLVRRLDASRLRLNPRFIIVNNGRWDENGSVGLPGEQYVDGVFNEHHSYGADSWTQYLQKPFADRGHRRVLVLSSSDGDAAAWKDVPGVTNISSQPNHGYAPQPLIGLNRVIDRPKIFGHTTVGQTASVGMSADRKRASKFTLGEKATLLELWAYLDGNGGVSGNQTVRLVLYRDNNGAPAAKVAESSTHWLGNGAPANWRPFTVPNVPLDPGSYWIAVFTGGAAGVVRNFGDPGAINWFNNDDLFSDGAADPYGAGNTGDLTLSVYATYTVGQ